MRERCEEMRERCEEMREMRERCEEMRGCGTCMAPAHPCSAMCMCACARTVHTHAHALLVRGTCVYLSIHTIALGVSLSPRCTALEPTHLPLAWACSFESTRCMKPLTWRGGVA